MKSIVYETMLNIIYAFMGAVAIMLWSWWSILPLMVCAFGISLNIMDYNLNEKSKH